MTEKEIAKKVWGVFDAYREAICGKTVGVFRENALTATSQLEQEVEKILPRPKRKVKKTLRRWVAIYKNPNGHIWTGGTFEYKDSIDSDDEELNFKRVCHLEEIGRKEIEITFEVEE